MNQVMAAIIVILLLLLMIIGGVIYVIARIRHAAENISRQAFGTSDLREGFRQMEREYSMTPKSVSAMTSLYLPKIKKDFPEFQYDEMKVRAENALTSYLLSVDGMNPGALKEGNRELKDKLEMRIQMLKGMGEREHYRDIHLHRMEIADYRKRDGRCIITFQAAVQYFYTRKDESGKLLEGNEGLYTQSKYNVDLIYIQDRDRIAEERDHSLGLNCPNCGAPISSLGSKKCEYCGTPIVELNIYSWTFSNIEEIK